MSGFAQNVIKELNKFRSNPKSIQHQCELVHHALSRLKGNDPFLKEIESFIKELQSMRSLPELKYNEDLTEAAKKELPNFRGRENYKKYKKANALKGIVPDSYLEANPALVADDGADQPINVLTKTLLNKNDKAKDGRAILCDPKYTQVGIAHEEFQEENMVILIFSTKFVDSKPIKTTKNDFIMNIQYHETKDIKKPKLQAVVYHRIKGDIFGGGNFEKTSFQKQIFTQGGNRPKLEQKPENPPKLKGTKSASRITAKVPTTATGKKEKVEETSMKRRNEGVGSKTTTKTESKTTASGIRGQEKESSMSTKTTTTKTTTRRGGETTTETKTETEGTSLRQKYSKKRRF